MSPASARLRYLGEEPMKHTLQLLAAAFAASFSLAAQSMPAAIGWLPMSESKAPARAARPHRHAALAEAPITRLAALPQEQTRPYTGPGGILHAGRRRALASTTGAWETMPNGNRIWRAALESPGAKGLMLRFTGFAAGSGNVWIYPANDDSVAYGPYTGFGPNSDGEFWSEMVFDSDRVVVEFETADPAVTQPPFHIAEVAHLNLDPASLSPAPRLQASGRESGAVCYIDAACLQQYPEWWNQAQSVGHMIIPAEEGLMVCSGALLNNMQQSKRPYFLTANHCVSDQQSARGTIIVWLYQSEYCDGPAPGPQHRNRFPQQRVERLLATGWLDKGDYTLLLLSGAPPKGVIFSGWHGSEEPGQGATLVGIHHPNGEYKRVSVGLRTPDAPTYVDDMNGGANLAPALYFYQVRWTAGMTFGGSSGSPLFNRNGQIVGTLSFGAGDCGTAVSGYGRFSRYFKALQQWLVDDRI